MILYHGTNTEFNEIDVRKSNPYKDFGQGFYLTDIEEQARNLANKKARIFGGTPTVMKFMFDENLLTETSDINVLRFTSPNKTGPGSSTKTAIGNQRSDMTMTSSSDR